MTKPETAPLTLRAQIEKRPLTEAFHITGYTFTESEVLVVSLHDGERTGHGEGLGVYYRHDTPASMLKQIEGMRETIERGMRKGGSQHRLAQLLVVALFFWRVRGLCLPVR